MTVAVVTDSVADLPSEVVDELGITMVSLYVQIGKESYRALELDKSEFYRRLDDKDYPRTSMPNPNDFLTAYSKLAEKTDEILCITISSKLGNTHASASAAAKEMKETGAKCHIEVIDSKLVLLAQGFLAIEAAKAAREGMGLGQLADMVRGLLPKAHVVLAFNTLKYLHRGGYVGRAKMLLASAFGIYPLIEIREEVLPYGSARGRAGAMDALCKFASSFRLRSLGVEYATDPDDAQSLTERLKQMFPGVPLYTSMVNPVIAAHTGAHVFAVSVLEE